MSGRHDRNGVGDDVESVFALFPIIKEFRRRPAGALSGGQQQQLAIGRALVARPKVILLDEPSLGLAPLIVESIFGIIRRLKKERGQIVLLVEQNAALVLDLADHGYVMENGRIVLEGPAAGLRENPEIKEFYLNLNEVGARRSYRDARQHWRRRRVPARMKGGWLRGTASQSGSSSARHIFSEGRSRLRQLVPPQCSGGVSISSASKSSRRTSRLMQELSPSKPPSRPGCYDLQQRRHLAKHVTDDPERAATMAAVLGHSETQALYDRASREEAGPHDLSRQQRTECAVVLRNCFQRWLASATASRGSDAA
jgi:ABC-type glutathione transport system ATPase component